jgi:hypothetical protein
MQVLSRARVAGHAAVFACRESVSNVFSIPDRNALWNREEDDLLVPTVVRHSASETFL